jgi:hypothetical protein
LRDQPSSAYIIGESPDTYCQGGYNGSYNGNNVAFTLRVWCTNTTVGGDSYVRGDVELIVKPTSNYSHVWYKTTIPLGANGDYIACGGFEVSLALWKYANSDIECRDYAPESVEVTGVVA